MKLAEMAELLAGLADAMERFLGKPARSDLLAVSDCFREFGDDSTKSFCDFVKKAKNGQPAAKRRNGQANEEKVRDYTETLRHFFQHKDEYDYSSLRRITGDIGKLRVPEIKAIGDNVGCPLGGKRPKWSHG